MFDMYDARGYQLERKPDIRNELPIDFRFMRVSLCASGDPEVGWEWWIAVGPGSRLPRVPALYAPDHPNGAVAGESVWTRNISSCGCDGRGST